MDWNRLLQGMGGRLLRQGLGLLMREGVKRIGGPQKPKAQMTPQERAHRDRSGQMQQRLEQAMKIGRRFWR
ncbi:MAG: hypothetical protein RL216_3008 [Pseudomonadota bacterium]|jgi:hypothetical protein